MISGERSTAVPLPTLGDVPLAHALVTIRHRKLSGVFELRASAGSHAWLVFWHGLIVSATTTPTLARFGTVAYELGLLDAQALDGSTLEATRTKRPLMEILVERGTITAAQRDAILVEQVRRRIHHLFTMPPSTTFAFREGRPSTAEPTVNVDPLAGVWRGLCEHPPAARVGEVLTRIGERPLRLVVASPLALTAATAAELALTDLLAPTPMTVRQLRSAAKLPSSQVDLLIYLLVVARSVEVVGAEQPVVPSREMWATVAPEGAAKVLEPPEPRRLSSPHGVAAQPLRGPVDLGIDEVRRRALGLAAESPFETLGLVEGASSEAARAAYFRLAKLWNPARLPVSLDLVRPEVTDIFEHMTRAHALLTDPAARPAVVSRPPR